MDPHTETCIAEWRRVRSESEQGGGVDLRVGTARTLLVGDAATARFMLAAMAGFAAHRGELQIDGRPVGDLAAHRRRVTLIGPELGLPAHGRVAAIAARTARGGPALEAALTDAGLSDRADRTIGMLDAGERVRLAIARAAASHPRLLAIDGALDPLDPAEADAALRALAAVRARIGCAVVIHTARPGALIGRPVGTVECVAAIAGGRVVQADTPGAVYDDPADPAVLGLLGPTNFLAARVLDLDDDGGRCTLDGGTVVEATATPASPKPGGACRIDVRPERIALAIGTELAGDGGLIGRIEAVSHEGPWTSFAVRLRAGDLPLMVRRPAGSPLGRLVAGADVSVAWQAHHARIWPA